MLLFAVIFPRKELFAREDDEFLTLFVPRRAYPDVEDISFLYEAGMR
jgi:hypothetical protein